VLFDFVDSERIDGFVVAAPSLANYAGNSALEKLLVRFQNIPMVNLGENILNIPAVLIDNETGICEIMKHMIEYHGYKRIAYISGLAVSTEASVRFHTYQKMLNFYGLPYEADLVYEGNFSINSGKSAIRELLDIRKVKFDAIVSANDYMALGAIDELRLRGMVAGNLIPISGYDDINESKKAGLTTVHQPIYEEGHIATELLVKKIRGEEIPQITQLPTKIVVRESCGCHLKDTFPACKNYLMAGNSLDTSFQNNQNFLIEKISKMELADDDKKMGYLISSIKSLQDSFVQALNQKRLDIFLLAWGQVIQECYEIDENLSYLNTLLSDFRRSMVSFIKDRELLIVAEDMFHSARIMIGDSLQKAALFSKILETAKIEKLNDFGARLTSTFDLKDQFDIIQSELSSLGINSCFISLYTYPEIPKQEARLVFGFEDDNRLMIPEEGITFPPGEIVPFKIARDRRRCTYIVENMFHRTLQLGFIVMEYGPKDDRMYEILRTKINDSIMGTIMFQKVQKQAERLEQLVQRRTSELHMMKFIKDKVEDEVEKLTIHISRKQETKPDEKSSMVYKSMQMQEVVNKVNQAVRLSKPILITGETGTGKELIAKLIHYTSSSKDEPFIAINCAAIPQTLWEAELFGYIKGSFTDAKADRRGSIDAAGKGSLFFDEIGETPLDIQSKLLRLLQENQYKPIGSNKFFTANCRFIFATNKDLSEMIKKGKFREDLYYRISVFTIEIPPLRDRKEDIPILLEYFIKKYSGEFALPEVIQVEKDVMEKILSYRWPGNIREMENFVIRSLAILSSSREDKGMLKIVHLPSLIADFSFKSDKTTAQEENYFNHNNEIYLNRNYEELVDQYSKKIILWALDKANGNKTVAANMLGIKRTTLSYKIKELKIENYH